MNKNYNNETDQEKKKPFHIRQCLK